ncbi:MAG: DUF2752 domain-containing protein [Dysgonamonadaceae bacterium]|jgi:hypothetical protein|nr:DUF2752 domain-containing protein [Dysgonamonadaceae bacterium]
MIPFVEWLKDHLLTCPSKHFFHTDCPGCGLQRSVLVPAIIALFLAKAAKKQYFDEPEKFIPGSYQNLNTGNTCAWFGLVISIISLVSWIVYIVFFTMNSQFREQMQEIMKQYQA